MEEKDEEQPRSTILWIYDYTQYPEKEINIIKKMFFTNVIPSSTLRAIDVIKFSQAIITHIVLWKITDVSVANTFPKDANPITPTEKYFFWLNSVITKPITVIIVPDFQVHGVYPSPALAQQSPPQQAAQGMSPQMPPQNYGGQPYAVHSFPSPQHAPPPIPPKVYYPQYQHLPASFLMVTPQPKKILGVSAGNASSRSDPVTEEIEALFHCFTEHLAQTISRIVAENSVVWPSIGSQVASDETLMYYTIGTVIAEGAFAIVCKCTDFFGQPFVVKIQKPQREKKLVKTTWKAERDFMLSLNHPNVIRLYDSFIYNNLYYYVLEEAQGSLRDLIKDPSKIGVTPQVSQFGIPVLPFDFVMQFTGQILSALCSIHKNKIVHRDLQIDNILYRLERGALIFKISDFGISKRVSKSTNLEAIGFTGRGWEVSPELLQSGRTRYNSDLFQLGLIVFHLVTGLPPIVAADGDGKCAILAGIPQQKAMTLNHPLRDWLAQMLERDPNKRFANSYDAWQAARRFIPQ